jgi:hypothetical protein
LDGTERPHFRYQTKLELIPKRGLLRRKKLNVTQSALRKILTLLCHGLKIIRNAGLLLDHGTQHRNFEDFQSFSQEVLYAQQRCLSSGGDFEKIKTKECIEVFELAG